MPFITLGGVECAVPEGSFRELPSIYQGGRERMRAGNIVSTEELPMRVWEFQIDFYSQADEDTVRAACLRGVPVEWDFGSDILAAVVDFGNEVWTTAQDDAGNVLFIKTVDVHAEQVPT